MSWRLEMLSLDTLNGFVAICEELLLLGEQSHLKFSAERTLSLGIQCINDPSYFCVIAFDDKDVIVGCMAGYVTQLIFSNNYIGNEEGLYVRDGTVQRAAIAAEMLRRFVRFCEDCGAIDVRTGVISNIDNYAADVFYRRNGFKRIGTIYALKQERV